MDCPNTKPLKHRYLQNKEKYQRKPYLHADGSLQLFSFRDIWPRVKRYVWHHDVLMYGSFSVPLPLGFSPVLRR